MEFIAFNIGIFTGSLFLIPFCSFKVKEGHVASLSVFGEAAREGAGELRLWQAGIHFKLPWAKVRYLSLMEKTMRLHEEDLYFSAVARDGSVLNLKSKVRLQARVEDAETILYGVEDPLRQVRSFLKCALSAQVADFGAETAPGDVFIQLRAQKKEFLRRFQSTVSGHLHENYGVKIIGMDLLDVSPPDELAQSLNSVQTARADADSSIARAQAMREKRLYSAKEKLEIARLESSAHEQEIRVIGEGLKELQANQTLKNYLLRREHEVFNRSKTAVVKREGAV